MRVEVVGRGPLADPLVRLAERAGDVVDWVQQPGDSPTVHERPDLVILAGSRSAVEPLLTARLADAVVIDATIPTHNDGVEPPAEPVASRSNWIANALPRAQVVRAFASVPADSLVAVLDASRAEDAGKLAIPLAAPLAVPFAGDDREAKALVERFMRGIGVEPYDLGALRVADALEPGGALWGKALSPVEMLEAVGWLSGDG
jgi:8-hydroxy-5-deazaflavin:NADPH oxidoreductase